MDDRWVPWFAFGLPLVIVVGIAVTVAWLFGKPARDLRRLERRAAAGDPSARAALARAKELEAALGRALGRDDPERQRVLASGQPASATILGVRPTGVEVAAGPAPAQLVEVDLSVQEGRGPARSITVRDAVSELHLGRLLKGATVPVRVDPSDPEHVVVLWDRL